MSAYLVTLPITDFSPLTFMKTNLQQTPTQNYCNTVIKKEQLKHYSSFEDTAINNTPINVLTRPLMIQRMENQRFMNWVHSHCHAHIGL